jgi:hypothetical protein
VSFITPLLFSCSFIYFFLVKKNLDQFFLFGLITFNCFIFYGVSIFDELLLFIVILKITYENFYLKKQYLNSLEKILFDVKENLKSKKLIDYIILIILLNLIVLSCIGVIFYDVKIIRFIFLFSTLFIFFLFCEKFFINLFNLENSIFITKTTIFVLGIYLVHGIIFEITNNNFYARYNTQGVSIAGSSISMAILIFSSFFVSKIYTKNHLLVYVYFVLSIVTSCFFSSRLGLAVAICFLLINFYRNYLFLISVLVLSFTLSISIEFSTSYFKHILNQNDCKTFEKPDINKLYECDAIAATTNYKYASYKTMYWYPSLKFLENLYQDNQTQHDQDNQNQHGEKSYFKQYDIFIKPEISDFGRRLMVLTAFDFTINNPNLIYKIFGNGFYSHKQKLVDPLNKILSKKKKITLVNDQVISNYKSNYVKIFSYPVRTANLPSIIIDGGLLLLFLFLSCYLVISLNIIINYENVNLFLNKSLIYGSLFILNYVNFNLDLIFIWVLLSQSKYLQNNQFNE